MSRASFALVALLLAVLLPLVLGHCMFMGLEAAPATASEHGCCPGGTPAPAPTEPDACPCFQLPPAAMSAPVVLALSVHDIGTSIIDDARLAATPAAERPGRVDDSPDEAALERSLEHHESRGPPLSA